MKVIKLRDNSAIFLEKDVNLEVLLGSNKRFIKIGDMVINRADITAVVSKDQYDSMVRQSNGLVLTSQGWMGKREYSNSGFLKIQIPDELYVKDTSEKVKDNPKELLSS